MSDYDFPTTSVDNLTEQVWYHGMLTRIKSEQMVREDGEFLVRDSISMSGEYVLTAMWNNRPLHFQINSAIENKKQEFFLEEESFDSVLALVNFYRSHRRTITAASGCIISTPVGRDRDNVESVSHLELEASYMHVLKPCASQVTPQPLSQMVLLNQAILRQNAFARQQRPKSSITHHQISVALESVPVPPVPPVPTSLINRPLPLPLRSPRVTQDNDEDYSEMDYDAMNEILDASSASVSDKTRNSCISLISNVMSRKFQSCQNLSYRSHSSSATLSRVPPPLPARPPLPPRPNFRLETNTVVADVLGEHSQSEDASDSALVDYDEPRTKSAGDDYDKLPSTTPCSPDAERHRFSIGSSDCDSSDSGVRVSRDSGIYSSPSPADEHHASLSQVHLMQLKEFLLSKRPDEISLALSHENAKILRFLESVEKSKCKTNNGLRLVLLPSGSFLRQELIERCDLLRYTCLLSILSSSRRDAHRILKKWILTAMSLAHHGDAFACSCIAGALSEKSLRNMEWLWTSLDARAKKEYDILKRINESLMKGDRLEQHNHSTVIPFLQPILEIMSGSNSHYVDATNFATEVESLWAWLERARHWCMRADDSCQAARDKYGRADGSIMSSSFLSRLFVDASSHEDRQRVLHCLIRKLVDERS